VPKLNEEGLPSLWTRLTSRALALKALDQRLHAANVNKSTTPAPAVAPMVASINSGPEEVTKPNDTEAKEEESA